MDQHYQGAPGPDPILGQTIGNYQVRQKLGEGGMGSVYMAEHPHIGKKVALKVLHAEFASNQDVVSRFFNEAKAVKAIQTLVDWRNAGYTPEQTEYPASVALFSAGDAAFHLNGVWEVPTFTDLHAKGSLADWSAAVVPPLMGAEATWADSHAFALPQQPGKEPDPEKRKAVMEVIGWMEKHALRWADAGHIPAYLPVATSDEYKAMEPNSSYAELADTAAYDPRSTIAGVASPVYDAALNIIVPAVHGFLTPEEAVAQMKEQLQPLLN